MKTISYEQVVDEYGIAYFRGLASFGALSDEVITYLLASGVISSYAAGEVICKYGERDRSFAIIINGDVAFYKHCKDRDVLTRHFISGDQMCFDLMIGLIKHNGTEIADKDSLILEMADHLLFDLHEKFPQQFGLFMINMSRELSREISLLEEVIGDSTGWEKRNRYKKA
ncbi:hypothetical protein [Amphritea sp. HPY]|uniref:hypothetical protein n=1 Tax=Amphritea sp. HPY TaxID=3421652 RepID=UPI003D7D82F1